MNQLNARKVLKLVNMHLHNADKRTIVSINLQCYYATLIAKIFKCLSLAAIA
jgi:hypothetical protein